MDTRKVFDPFAEPESVDIPVLRIGGRDYELVTDILASTQRKLESLQKRFVAVSESDSPDTDTAVRLVCEMAQAATVGSDGLADAILELWESDKIGMRSLSGLVKFIAQHLADDADPEG